MQHEAILILNSTSVGAEFNVTVNSGEDMQRLCRIVSYYYLVEAIDNDSNIYYYMKQNAMDALSYWVSFTSYLCIAVLACILLDIYIQSQSMLLIKVITISFPAFSYVAVSVCMSVIN